jgi:hypothetical protein
VVRGARLPAAGLPDPLYGGAPLSDAAAGNFGPVKPVPGPATAFYPYHAIRDTIAVAVVFALLLTMAIVFNAPLDAIADPPTPRMSRGPSGTS